MVSGTRVQTEKMERDRQALENHFGSRISGVGIGLDVGC